MNNNHFTTLAVASALALVVFVSGVSMYPHTKEEGQDPVGTREVVSYAVLPGKEGGESVVQYGYQGEKVPEKLAPGEVTEKRTENSYTRQLSVQNEGTKDETRTYAAVFYSKQTFAQQGNDWYYVEYATTTETSFNNARKDNALASLFWKKAYAASVSPFSAAGDGYIYYCYCDGAANWNGTHDGTAGTVDYTATGIAVYASQTRVVELPDIFIDYYIGRTFFPFDTSSIPSGATITAASLNVYVTAITNTDNDGDDFITVVQTSQAGHTTLVTGDYDQCGAINTPTEGIDSGNRKDISSISTSAYSTFTLNSTGMGWIAKSGQASACSGTAGITCLGIREGHDVIDSAVAGNNKTNSVTLSSSENTGTSVDPYLSVTYTAAAGFAFWQFQDF